MRKEAWDKLDETADFLGTSRGGVVDLCLQKMRADEVDPKQIIQYHSGCENPTLVKRRQAGIFFLPESNEYLSKVIRYRYGVSMSNFIEQLIMRDDLMELFRIRPD